MTSASLLKARLIIAFLFQSELFHREQVGLLLKLLTVAQKESTPLRTLTQSITKMENLLSLIL